MAPKPNFRDIVEDAGGSLTPLWAICIR